jgi:hypothetical protein
VIVSGHPISLRRCRTAAGYRACAVFSDGIILGIVFHHDRKHGWVAITLQGRCFFALQPQTRFHAIERLVEDVLPASTKAAS